MLRVYLQTFYICVIACNILIFLPADTLQPFSLTPSELQSLENLTPQTLVDPAELIKWDNVAQELLIRFPLSDGGSTRLTAYLYEGQRAFADASQQLTGKYSGSLNPISFSILKLFFPNYQETTSDSDPFSNQLSTLLSQKIAARFNQEQAGIHPISYTEKPDAWKGIVPYIGLIIPSMKTWEIKINKFIAAPPPPAADSAFWQNQLDQVKKAMVSATDKEKQDILFWAGMGKPGAGDWIQIANQHMTDNKVSLGKQLEVRATLAKSQLDTLAAIFASKYKYMVRRPNMLDPALKTFIQTPNHPSYPAGHSTGSKSAAVVLSYYFPEKTQEWDKLARECGLSRIRAGIHFPIDHTGGEELGLKIGQDYTQRLKTK